VTYFSNFGTAPNIYGTAEYKNLLFKFWDPPNISGTAEDTDLKFCTHIVGKAY